MKNQKVKIYVVVICMLLNSCILKSLQPFYTTSSQFFEKRLEGNWETKAKSTWNFRSFKSEMELEKSNGGKIDDETLKMFSIYKNAYIVEHISNNKNVELVAVPFKVEKHIFLDFTPIDIRGKDLNSIAAQHILKTHSVALVKFKNDGSLQLKWLGEKVIKNLIKDQKLRLKHEKIGFDEDLVLTANSEELHTFLKRFMSAEIENKWDNDDIVTLSKTNAKS